MGRKTTALEYLSDLEDLTQPTPLSGESLDHLALFPDERAEAYSDQ